MRRRSGNPGSVFPGIALVGGLLAAPLFLPLYHVNLLTEVIVFALYAVSYNLLLGYAGLLSFGHAMFFGTGAYVTAVALAHLPGLSVGSAILLSVAAATLAGVVTGALLLRHKGSYFALLTLAFNALFYAVATKWHSVTGGDDGLSVNRPNLDFLGVHLDLSDITTFYYFALITVGALIGYCWHFTHTAMGRTVLLVRENEERMKFLGYDTNISRLLLFTFTGALAGCAGSYYALFFEFTSISAISIEMTTTVLLMTFIGGTGSFLGPVLGALVYTLLHDKLSDITDRWPLIMGLIFIVMVLYVPGGLSGLIVSIRERLAGTAGKNAAQPLEGRKP
ncbi:branched-chain amino acid transport system permease protein [Desulfacinum infernum DSM 9756]|uniref:Branched-chain amino acid transport system permease protein n=1 Tax=Desulfacinum infernum DSM 9756 TaxID=1121391 RepID=A0A1M4UAL9_9BACT|nr:branched-chain amino acid ABC transporter permease [Desulfacinum infernum]SHE53921.1 branched-chain amino acid transport system permease protein [Desulfacinum infernum DSM 9756]